MLLLALSAGTNSQTVIGNPLYALVIEPLVPCATLQRGLSRIFF